MGRNVRSRAWRSASIAIALFVAATVLPQMPLAPLRPRPAAAQTAAVTLAAPQLLHANGAELRWSRYSAAGFVAYEVHRSTAPSFTPSAATRVAVLGDQTRTYFRDTTAAPSQAFSYKVVVAGAASNEQRVTLPPAGEGRALLRPAAAAGRDTFIERSSSSTVCTNHGPATELKVGATDTSRYRALLRFDLRGIPVSATVTSATLSLSGASATVPATLGAIDVHRATRAWTEGGGGCGAGANWYQAHAGVAWASDGGDFASPAAASSSTPSNGLWQFSGAGLKALVQDWVGGERANHGVVLKLADETGAAGRWLALRSSDYATESARPQLAVTFAENSASRGPSVALGKPGPGTRVVGTSTLGAVATDDGAVAKVEFLLDGAVIGTDTSAPYEISWRSTSATNGNHSLSAKAYDDVGNTATTSARQVVVDNTAAPTTSVASPAAGATVAGTYTVTAGATPPSGETITKVEFYFDDMLFGEDATSPYSAPWNTLDPLNTAFDGSHVLTTKAYDSSGNVTTSAARSVTVANTAGTKYKATFDVNEPGSQDDVVSIPQAVLENQSATAPQEDPYDPNDPKRTLDSAPVDSTSTGGGGLQDAASVPARSCRSGTVFCLDVTVTNTSNSSWRGGDMQLWYRWFTPDGYILYEGPGNDWFPQTVRPGQAKTIPMDVYAPKLPPGVQLGQYNLRFDIYDAPAGRWFGGKGNRPVTNPIIVNKALDSALGLEKYYQYEGENVGGGVSQLTNVANGNSLLRFSPFFSPGRGLSTVVDLTYNSLEDHSESPVGNNFSLSISSLTRFGNPIDIHPNKADEIGGVSNRYVVITDGDGTTHRFEGEQAADGTVYWKEPPGVHLYLREYSSTDPARKWAFTRPDRVTYFYDVDGFPTFVRDRNGNEIKFVLETTPPGEDPGGPKKRITQIVDPGGRSFRIDYYSKTEARKAHVRGNIETITDHTGSVLHFSYYDDGNLMRITQRGGTNADGSFLADRSWVITYVESDGEGPASTNLLDPDPKTPNQANLVYSVADPRRNVTKFDYYGPSEGSHLRSKLQSRTNRGNDTTGFAYDIVNRRTTVTAPLARVTKYSYDTDGKVTSIVDPANRTTGLTWNSDFHVTEVAEPGSPARYLRYTYNDNGYVTSFTNQVGDRTELIYENLAVDARDRSPYWKTGRTIPHVSQVVKKTNPRGVPTADPDDYQWNYVYDDAGNMIKAIDPEPADKPVTERYTTRLTWNPNGTLASVTDQRDEQTSFPAYDANGFATEIVDPEQNRTRFFYDDDGLLRWMQDARHAGDSGTDERSYRVFLEYDSFHRLGRQSAPKSTRFERGSLLWSSAEYDPNDNVVARTDPEFGYNPPTSAPTSRFDFDAMDRQTRATNQDGEKTEYAYDAAGRLTRVTRPRGAATTGVPNDFAVIYDYDVLDRVVKQTRHEVGDGGGVVESRFTHFCYDAAGDMVSVTTPRAAIAGAAPCPATGVPFTWKYEFDLAHRLVKSIDPKGNARGQHFDPNGNVDFVTNENQDTFRREFDERDLLVKIVEPFNNATGRTLTTKFEYDGARNMVRRISPRGWDASADKAAFTQYVTQAHYDGNNRVVRVDLPTSTQFPEQSYVHKKYDGNGNLLWTSLPTTRLDPLQVSRTAKTEMTYFDPGWMRTQEITPNPKIHYDYSARGEQVLRVPEQNRNPGELDESQRMTWEYFPDGMLQARRDNDGHPSTYRYDPNNNLVSALDAAGVVAPGETPVQTQADYTDFDEVLEVRHRKRPESGPEHDWTFTRYEYDLNGNVKRRLEDGKKSASTGAQIEAPREHVLQYDAADWLELQKDLGKDGACKGDQKVVNAYFPTGWEKQRDVFRAPDSCTGGDQYDKKQSTTWTYFANGKLRTLETRNGSGSLLESHEVGYFDAAGNYVNGHRTRDDYVLKGPNATVCTNALDPCTARWFYNAQGRLIEHRDGHGGTTTYALDEPSHLIGDSTIRAGNVTTEDTPEDPVTTREYEGSRLTTLSVPGATAEYWYDDFGNVDCVTLQAGDQSDCSPAGQGGSSLLVDYTYDYLNRLESYRSYAGGTQRDSAEYAYDALDRLVRQTQTGGADGTKTTDFSYMGLTDRVTEERQRDGSGSLTNRKTYSYDAYGHRISMTQTKTGQPTEHFTYGYDVHGSVSLLVGDAGQVRASYGYRPYGEEDPELTKGDDPVDPVNAYRYTGKRFDTASGTVDMGARRFSPDDTRFLQQDVLYSSLANLGLSLDPLTQNRYSFAGGNPVSFVEVDGHIFYADGAGGSTTSDGGSSSDDGSDGEGFDWDAVTDAVGDAAEAVSEYLGEELRETVTDALREFGDEADDLLDLIVPEQYADAFERGTNRAADFLDRHGRTIGDWAGRVGTGLEIVGGYQDFRQYQDEGYSTGAALYRAASENVADAIAGGAATAGCIAVTAGIATLACPAAGAAAGYLAGEGVERFNNWMLGGGPQRLWSDVSSTASDAYDSVSDTVSDWAGDVQDFAGDVAGGLESLTSGPEGLLTFWD
ncbi:MAG TPA: Ig-like domain-containing protein [Actinomycetota bacterium]|nr:Ig-like domain-containing protein [Actinomycetota bacterium]